jgi:threonine/homoserine/homoserine lactone efflux protein
MWMYVLQGIGFGFAAASQPGPFQTYLISQSISQGWRRTLPSALAPLLSDGPIIALCLLVLSQVPVWMEQVLYGVSGVFILYLAWGALRAWRAPPVQGVQEVETGLPMGKAVVMNMLSPGPYIFWTLVTGPILVAGWRESPMVGLSFLGGFYLTLVGALAAIVLVFGLAARFGEGIKHAMLGVSAIALLVFGLYQVSKALGVLQ